jgi:hypothetical protein
MIPKGMNMIVPDRILMRFIIPRKGILGWYSKYNLPERSEFLIEQQDFVERRFQWLVTYYTDQLL